MNDKQLLKDVLTFHVLSGKVMSGDLKNDMTAETLSNNKKLRVNIYGKVGTQPSIYFATYSALYFSNWVQSVLTSYQYTSMFQCCQNIV